MKSNGLPGIFARSSMLFLSPARVGPPIRTRYRCEARSRKRRARERSRGRGSGQSAAPVSNFHHQDSRGKENHHHTDEGHPNGVVGWSLPRQVGTCFCRCVSRRYLKAGKCRRICVICWPIDNVLGRYRIKVLHRTAAAGLVSPDAPACL